MSDLETKLIECFEAVLPDVPAADIPALSMATAASWDSVATLNLVAVIEETFERTIDTDALERFTSFAFIRTYLEGATADGEDP